MESEGGYWAYTRFRRQGSRAEPGRDEEVQATLAEVVYLTPRWSQQQDWGQEAACKGETRHFFAPHGEQAEAREKREAVARAICVTCPVILVCREYARRHRELGFWGGENDDQRLEYRRRARDVELRSLRSLIAEA